MATIAWLGIPLAATLLAIAWVFWVSRPRPPADMHETLASYERFKAAMSGERRRRWRRRRHDPERSGGRP